MSDTDPQASTDRAPDGQPAARASSNRVFLVVVDDTPEMDVALRFACLRARNTGGRVALLYVVEPADFCLLQLDSAPRLGVFVAKCLDDFLNLAAGSHALLLQLEEGFLRGSTRFVGIGKDAEFAS